MDILTAGGLKTTLDIINTDTASSFDCQALLHTYIRVPDIHHTQVSGFKDSTYQDKLTGDYPAIHTDRREAADFTGEVDRIYLGREGLPFNITIRDTTSGTSTSTSSATSTSSGGGDVMRVTCESYTTSSDAVTTTSHRSTSSSTIPTDCVLWNAWIDKTASIGDLNNDAYLAYVCVEPGLVAQSQTIAPGDTITLSQSLLLCILV